MSLTIVPFEESFAEIATGLAITGGQGGNAAKINARANAALAVAGVAGDLASGDAASAGAALSTLLSNSNIDPGVVIGLNGLIAFEVAKVSLVSAAAKMIPALGLTVEATVTALAAGMVITANAELAKYPLPAAAK